MGYLYIFAAAAIWGTMGLFFTVLHDSYGLSALSIAFLRASVPAIILLVALFFFRRDLLRVPRQVLVYYLAFGLLGIAAFYILAIQAVLLTNVAVASVLLYTAPVFVAIFAWWRWRESFTPRKVVALLAAFGGCALVARANDPEVFALNWTGIAVATLAGLAYAVFTIFGKGASGQSPWTTATWSLAFGALFLLPLQFGSFTGGGGLEVLLKDRTSWFFVLGLGLGPTLGSYALFHAGLRRVPASNASIVATIEPVVAALVGFLFLSQTLSAFQILGGVLIVAASASLARG
jgi:DME family drug/metabolite transporter